MARRMATYGLRGRCVPQQHEVMRLASEKADLPVVIEHCDWERRTGLAIRFQLTETCSSEFVENGQLLSATKKKKKPTVSRAHN